MRHKGYLTVKHHAKIPCGGGRQDIVCVHSQLCLLCGYCEIPVGEFDELCHISIELEFFNQHALFDL